MSLERDEMFTTAPSPAVSTMARHGPAREEEGRRDVEAQRRLEERLVGVHRRARHRAARVVDEDVEPAELGDRGFHQPLVVGGPHDVGGHDQGAPPARRISSATSSRSATVRAAHTTSAPASAKPMAMPRPMPCPAPVTIATWPSRRKRSRITSSSRRRGGARSARPRRAAGRGRCGCRARRGTRRGSRSRSASPSRRSRGCARGPAAIEARGAARGTSSCTGGSPSTSTSKRSPSGPNVQGGSRCSSPMSQLTATVMNGLPVHGPLPAETLRGDASRRDRPDRRVDRRGRDGHLVRACSSRDRGRSRSSSATMSTDWRKPLPRGTSTMMLVARLLRRLAEQHHVADHVGRAVGADVGELLGADVRDAPATAPTP